MNIGIDLQPLQNTKASGLGYYLKGLHQALQEELTGDMQITGLRSRWSGELSTPKRLWHDRFELPALAKRAGVNLIHQPAFSCPKSSLPVVWTLHDLRPVVSNEAMSSSASFFWKTWLPQSSRWATKIVCISENTKQDALRILPRDESVYSVIPVGIQNELLAWKLDAGKQRAAQQRFGISGSYLVAVSTIQPIKNFSFAVEFLKALNDSSENKRQLVIIGKKGWGYPAVVETMNKLGLHEGRDILITDYISDEEKWSLVAGAEAALMPSKYEGFGIPVIEAQTLGVPVIASNNSSLPDVVGDGGVLATTSDLTDWLRAFKELQATRNELIEKGTKNVQRFHWSTIAQQWLEIYQKTLNS